MQKIICQCSFFCAELRLATKERDMQKPVTLHIDKKIQID